MALYTLAQCFIAIYTLASWYTARCRAKVRSYRRQQLALRGAGLQDYSKRCPVCQQVRCSSLSYLGIGGVWVRDYKPDTVCIILLIQCYCG